MADLEAAQADITKILASNNVYTGALNITNAAELTFAESLGDKVAIINGNVAVTVSTANGLDAAAVSAVTSKMTSVVGTVTIDTNASLDFSGLTTVSGAYSVSNHDVDDSALTATGNLTANYDGAYSFPSLKTAAVITVTDKAKAAATATVAAKTGTTAVDFSGLTSATSINSNALAFDIATSIKIGDVAITSVTATKTTELSLGFDATLASLSITAPAATTITVGAKEISGATSIAAKTTAAASFPALTKAGAFTANTASVAAAAFKTASSTITLSEATAVSLPALTSVAGTFTAAKATSFSAAALASTQTITLAKATSIEIASTGTASLTVKDVVTSLNFTNLATAFDTDGMVKLASLTSNGKSNSGDLTVNEDNVLLVSVSLTGKHGTVVVGGTSAGLDKLTDLTTAGTVADLTVQNTKALVTPSLGHTEDAATGAKLAIKSNAKLTSFTTAVDKVTSFVVTGNAKLASFDASSLTTLPLNSSASTQYTFTVTGNSSAASGAFSAATGMTGAFTAAKAATATADAEAAIYAQASLVTLKPYLTAVVNAALPATGVTATASTTGSFDLDYLYGSTATTPVSTLAEVFGNSAATTINSTVKANVATLAAE